MYDGEDRVKQVDALQDLASNISFGSDDPTVPARDRVDWYCDESGEELPGWFDAHDRELLVRFVEEIES